VPRLSLWKDGKHSNDYKFIDRRISEMFTIGGTGVLLHKYLGTESGAVKLTTTAAQNTTGNVLTFASTASVKLKDSVYGPGIPKNTTVVAKNATTVTLSANTTSPVGIDVTIGFSSDATKPGYVETSANNIQDLLFLENRDRKYDQNVYTMRGVYQVSDQDFDLSQFGLFLATGTLFMTFHLNDMVDTIGRKIMNGDVLELQHLTDYDSLNDVPAALKRFFVVGDCSRASEGYSPTWWPHLWRCRLTPLVDSQEYKDILNNVQVDTDGDGEPDTPIIDIIGNFDILNDINDAIIEQARADVPKSGYNTEPFYIKPLDENGEIILDEDETADTNTITGDNTLETADSGFVTPSRSIAGYLTGDGEAPNGWPVRAGISFPTFPQSGDFCLRTDYLPNRLFRYDGRIWIRVEDVQRTILGQDAQNNTLLGTFVNNNNTYTIRDANGQAVTYPEKQSLSQALTPKADNL
jgi:hypothetical protein